ncbi:Na+/H+ antiporter subunit D [Bacillus sp. FSL W7-1360]
MNNLLILPVILPFAVGALLILFAKYGRLQRIISSIAVISLLCVSVYLAYRSYIDGTQTLELGNWQAPFGIVFVGDLFSTFMVVLSSIVGVVCLFFAFCTLDRRRERFYFYPFYFFLLTGVNGAFLTGDLFNLFVFFEVMLLSSYALIAFGGTGYQLREGFKYTVINVFASALFLVGVAYLYGITGTLNMADLAVRIGEIGQTGTLQVVAMIFFIVFAMKGALFPLYFWLPNSYYGPPAAIAALCGGLLTKVGIYAIIRSFTLIFTNDTGFTHTLLLWIAGLTMFFGILGAVAQFDFKRILPYNIISHVGYIIMGLGLYTRIALAGAVFYIAHHIIVKSSLFLFEGATKKVTGTSDLRQMGGLLKTHPWLAWLFLISALSLAGIPPFSGFFSKLPLIRESLTIGNYWIAAVALVVGILTLISMMRIFSHVFWGEQKHTEEQAAISLKKPLLAIVPLVILTIILGLGAEPVFLYSLEIADQLLDPTTYIDAVLGEAK